MFKKFAKIILLLAVIIVSFSGATMLSGCGGDSSPPDIVVTIFPAYDWVKVVLGNNPKGFNVHYLMENGTDPHFYSPSFQDTAYIISSKLFVYIGEAETKVVPVLKQNPGVNKVSLMNLVETRKREDDAHLGSEDEDCDTDCVHGDLHDEHVWLSLRFARVFVSAIENEISKLDPSNKSVYKANADAYIQKLYDLDNEYEEAVGKDSGRGKDKILLADRFPFMYLVDDYGIKWDSAFSSCSTDTAITPQNRNRLEGVVNGLGLDVILILENSTTGALAGEIVGATVATKVRVISAMQIVSKNAIKANNLTYLSIMKANLTVLKEALA
ncbi:MAG: metal ABC transporter substrate-binding protein [Firmicutes bacterium]|nr:metal ABC transporter substrate-binding protein [Bacillota bacterium]